MTQVLNALRSLADAGAISELDYQFARFIGERCAMQREILLASAAVSYELSRMNSCLDLQQLCNQKLLFGSADLVPPSLDELQQKLQQADAVGRPGDAKPLILEAGRLYLNRYFAYESAIAADLLRRATADANIDVDSLATSLQRYFPGEQPDRQKLATAIAASRRLAVITGGPGTGKTTTVVRMLALLLERAELEGNQISIKLAAPTGKAAMRLTESIKSFLADEANLPCSKKISSEIPTQVSTLHRLLGVRRHGDGFRHTRDHPLRVDVLVIDEVSMVDLAMMARLLAALPAHTRLILVGDQHQLPSVEVGNLLADLSPAAGDRSERGYSQEYGKLLNKLCGFESGYLPAANPISDSWCELQQGYRFTGGSDIAQLADEIRRGNREALQGLLAAAVGQTGAIKLLPSESILSSEGMDRIVRGYKPFLDLINDNQVDTKDKLAAFDQFRVLSALREGESGVIELNQQIESRLQFHRLLELDQDNPHYPGRPIMVTRNDYNLQLFNGDTGICLLDPQDGKLKVCFLDSDGTVRSFLPTRLPPHETCFAMTVHKSQGSEYNHVALVLPQHIDVYNSDLLNRELLYTGITRARERVTLFAHQAIVIAIAERSCNRKSGLREKLMV